MTIYILLDKQGRYYGAFKTKRALSKFLQFDMKVINQAINNYYDFIYLPLPYEDGEVRVKTETIY